MNLILVMCCGVLLAHTLPFRRPLSNGFPRRLPQIQPPVPPFPPPPAQGVEATLFATLMSVLNAGGFTGQALGSALTTVFGVTSDDFGRLPQLVTFVTLCTLAPLPLLRLIPPASTLAAAEEHGRKDG